MNQRPNAVVEEIIVSDFGSVFFYLHVLASLSKQSEYDNEIHKRLIISDIIKNPSLFYKAETNKKNYLINSCLIGLKLSISLAIGVSRRMVCF